MSLYALGQIDLTQRARSTICSTRSPTRVRDAPDAATRRAIATVLDELNERLVDKYFVNFSVFESIPDVWAIDQVFPIVPIERLDEAPTRRGVIADLTCDSDGTHRHLRRDRRPRQLAAAARAARTARAIGSASSWSAPTRRSLGDIHNLFGDTDTVERAPRRRRATR